MVNRTGFWRWLKDNIVEGVKGSIEEMTDSLKKNLDWIAFLVYVIVPPILILTCSFIFTNMFSRFFLLGLLLLVPWLLGVLYVIWWDENVRET
jgi:hypothetical protein